MKRIIFWIGCFIFMNITTSGMTISKALLDHNGTVSIFDGNDMQAAVDAAVDGDVIYLSLGIFKPFTINKMISIRGVGENSIVDGNVDIAIPGSPKLTVPLMETLCVAGTIKVSNSIYDLVIKKCKISYIEFNAVVDGVKLDRCIITSTLYLSSYINGMTVNNCILNKVEANKNATNNSSFVNCDFYILNAEHFSGEIKNSILYRNSVSSNYEVRDTFFKKYYTINSSIIINCLILKHNDSGYYGNYGFIIGESSVTTNCYWSFPSNIEELKEKGFLDDNGTIVGVYGGNTPYTLEPSVPNVTSSNISFDEDKKLLNVKLTVSPQ